MTECRTPDVQDLLPDYVAESLGAADIARVESHLATCAVCADDLALLRVVRAARPSVSEPDIARIVAALPAHGTAMGPRLVRDMAAPPSVRVAASAAVRARRGPPIWRMAAALGVVIAGSMSILVARRGLVPVSPASDGLRAAAESVALVTPPANAPATGRTGAAVSVSYGDLGDYSEEELQRMLDRLDKWDGATNADPLPGVPMVSTSGGSD
jgi:anti-sigma factor RsiW